MISKKINEILKDAENCNEEHLYTNWENRVFTLLKHGVSEDVAREFKNYNENWVDDWPTSLFRQIGFLEGFLLRNELEVHDKEQNSNIIASQHTGIKINTKKIFIVHGHDNEIKESTARFIEKLELEPIILHEQSNEGRTIIEKFEANADVGFAVILLTPDDIGATKGDETTLNKRARQNVILELGYFLGRLGRRRVFALNKQGIEIPSDYQGVIYTQIDSAGAWKTKLAQELVEVGFSINLQALIKN